MTSIRLKALLLTVIVGAFSIGLYDFMTNFETNGCEMTYMFQPLNFKVSTRYLAVYSACPVRSAGNGDSSRRGPHPARARPTTTATAREIPGTRNYRRYR